MLRRSTLSHARPTRLLLVLLAVALPFHSVRSQDRAMQDRLERLNAPDEVLARANEFLPYAIALDVREAWGDHLAEACYATTTTR